MLNNAVVDKTDALRMANRPLCTLTAAEIESIAVTVKSEALIEREAPLLAIANSVDMEM